MNAMRITQLLTTLNDDYDLDTGCAEQGADEDSVMLRSDDERTEVVLRFEEETWLISYQSVDSDESNVSVRLEGEGFGDEHQCELTDALDTIGSFTSDLGL